MNAKNEGPANAAVAHYLRRSAAFFTLATEGYPDPADGDVTPDEAEHIEWAHRVLGRALEAETFDTGEPAQDAP